MGLRVRRIVVLVRLPGIRRLALEARRHRIVRARIFGIDVGRADDHFRAEGAQRVDLFLRLLVGGREDALVALDHRRDGEAHAGVARRALDDRAARLELAGLLGVLDHLDRHPVLDRVAGIGGLDLGVDVGGDHAFGDAVETHQRRIPDRFEDVVVDSSLHGGDRRGAKPSYTARSAVAGGVRRAGGRAHVAAGKRAGALVAHRQRRRRAEHLGGQLGGHRTCCTTRRTLFDANIFYPEQLHAGVLGNDDRAGRCSRCRSWRSAARRCWPSTSCCSPGWRSPGGPSACWCGDGRAVGRPATSPARWPPSTRTSLVRFGHLQIMHVEFFALMLFALDRLIVARRFRDAVLAGHRLRAAGADVALPARVFGVDAAVCHRWRGWPNGGAPARRVAVLRFAVRGGDRGAAVVAIPVERISSCAPIAASSVAPTSRSPAAWYELPRHRRAGALAGGCRPTAAASQSYCLSRCGRDGAAGDFALTGRDIAHAIRAFACARLRPRVAWRCRWRRRLPFYPALHAPFRCSRRFACRRILARSCS